MLSSKPKTVKELFEFYYERFKPIYSHVEALTQPPTEMFFEVNAAFDHLSRLSYYGETEESVVGAACAHLKRGCFDAFKIFVNQVSDHYAELKRVDTSIIDNGEFDRSMLRLVAVIRDGTAAARMAEGDSRTPEKWHDAFNLWEPVYANCLGFEKQYYLNPKVEWARRKALRKTVRNVLFGAIGGIIIGVVGSLLAAFLYPPIEKAVFRHTSTSRPAASQASGNSPISN